MAETSKEQGGLERREQVGSASQAGGVGRWRGCAGRCPGGWELAAEGEPVLLEQLLRPRAPGAGGAGAGGGGPTPGKGRGQWKPVWLGPRGLGWEDAEPDCAERRVRGALVSVPGAPDVRRA